MPPTRDMAALITAVKPRARTDQYKVLSAMYCLGADGTPVTVREIKDLLRLHFGTKIPGNPSDRLRKLVGYVRVERANPCDGRSRQRDSTNSGNSAD